MDSTNQHLYRELMRGIKRRKEYIDALRANPGLAVFNWTYMESICLQIRMMLEHIAFACLVANGEKLDELPKKIGKQYHADDILKLLDGVHPECFPKPTLLVEDREAQSSPEVKEALRRFPQGNLRGRWVDRPEGDWLTRAEFRQVYGRLGQVLHARNPLGSQVEFEYYDRMTPQWEQRIVNLLRYHEIAVKEEDMVYIVVMHAVPRGSAANTPGDVQVAPFRRIATVG